MTVNKQKLKTERGQRKTKVGKLYDVKDSKRTELVTESKMKNQEKLLFSILLLFCETQILVDGQYVGNCHQPMS